MRPKKIDKLKASDTIASMRACGATWSEIARAVTAETGRIVSRDTVRRWADSDRGREAIEEHTVSADDFVEYLRSAIAQLLALASDDEIPSRWRVQAAETAGELSSMGSQAAALAALEAAGK